MVFFTQKNTCFFVQKKVTDSGGTPSSPFTDKIFGKKAVTDLGGTPPPPFTDKIRKVVFDLLPYFGGIFFNSVFLLKTLLGQYTLRAFIVAAAATLSLYT